MKTLNFYSQIVSSLDMVADEHGLLSTKTYSDDDNTLLPATVEGKRLVLPTADYLKADPDDRFMAFHPLSENVARGQSAVLRYLVKSVRSRITYKLVNVALNLCKIACESEYQNRLSTSWNEFFKGVADADDKTMSNFAKTISAALDHQSGLVSFYLRNRSKIGETEYLRTALVNFKIIDEIETGKPYGVTIRKKDIKIFKAIILTVFPEADVKDKYSVGVTNDVAPYFVAIMTAYANMASHLNEIIILLKALDSDVDKIPTDFTTALQGLSALKREIPPLDGNIGKVLKNSDEEEATTAQAAPEQKATDNLPPWSTPKEETQANAAANPLQQVTNRQAAPAANETGGASFRDIIARANPQQQVANRWFNGGQQQQPQSNSWNNNQQHLNSASSFVQRFGGGNNGGNQNRW